MDKIKKPSLFAVAIFFVLLILYGISTSSIIHGVNKNKAIELAKGYCSHNDSNADLQKLASGHTAELLTCGEIKAKTSFENCGPLSPEQKAWLVSVNGEWLLWGPPDPQETVNTPIQLTKCHVILDVNSGAKLDQYMQE